jgi:hypothetical protein
MDLQKLIYDFIAGGAMIATVLAIGKVFGPAIAGIIAALPVRLGATLFLSGVEGGPAFVLQMLRGSVPTSVGAFGFMLTLAKTTKRLGMLRSFILSITVCVIIIIIGVSVL